MLVPALALVLGSSSQVAARDVALPEEPVVLAFAGSAGDRQHRLGEAVDVDEFRISFRARFVRKRYPDGRLPLVDAMAAHAAIRCRPRRRCPFRSEVTTDVVFHSRGYLRFDVDTVNMPGRCEFKSFFGEDFSEVESLLGAWVCSTLDPAQRRWGIFRLTLRRGDDDRPRGSP